MDATSLKRNLPTIFGAIERRQRARKNRLPKHLLPPTLWPVWIQMALNLALITTQATLLINKDDYLTDVGPAIPMTISLLFLFYAVTAAFQLRARFPEGRGARLTKANFVLMIFSFLTWAATIASFLD